MTLPPVLIATVVAIAAAATLGIAFAPKGWSKLTSASSILYKLDEQGRIAIYAPSGDVPPFSASPEHRWSKGTSSREWILRTRGVPETMTKILGAFGALAAPYATHDLPLAGRVLLVQTACESAYDASHPSGRSLKSPRTELGYPERTGESDPGDFDRDLVDWNEHHGMHSSHGLTQCLIGVAVNARPDLFATRMPREYRTVLWTAEAAYACLAELYRRLPAAHRADPVATRVIFGSGSIRPARDTPWGVALYHFPNGHPAEVIITRWIAYWNDLAAITANPANPKA